MNSISIASRATAILREVYSQSSLESVTLQILETACEWTGSVHGSFIRVHRDEGRLSIEATVGPDWTEDLRSVRIPIGKGITGKVAQTGVASVCQDAESDPDYIKLFPYVRSELAMPVMVSGEVWGIINLDGTQPDEYKAHMVAEIRLFAELISAAIEHRLKNEEERELRNRLAQAEKLSSSGQLLAGIAHEINNPLAAILGTSSILAAELTDPAQIEAARLIEKQAQRAGDLIRHLLTFSRQSKDEGREVQDLISVVRESIEFVRPQLRLKRASLEFSVSQEAEANLLLNRTQVQQVLVNLITNAQHAVEEKGDSGRIHISVDTDQSHAYVAVEDNGTGMDGETRRKLYQPFYTTRKKGSGTGLGLSISQEIAARHLGRLSCTSMKHRGSRFEFRLPLELPIDLGAAEAEPLAASQPRVDLPSSPERREQSILIVDDEAPIRWMLRKLLQPLSSEVYSVESAEKALEFLEENQVDHLITDVHLPGMDGVTLSNQLSQQPHVPHIILMTGDITSPGIERVTREGNIQVMAKPFSPQALLDSISKQARSEDLQLVN